MLWILFFLNKKSFVTCFFRLKVSTCNCSLNLILDIKLKKSATYMAAVGTSLDVFKILNLES